jgi:hypothetical protein
MAARPAVLGLAGQIGAEIRERPVWPGAAGIMGCAEPAEGLRIVRTLEAAAARGQRRHQGRPLGRPDWQAPSLNSALKPGESGVAVAEAAFEFAARTRQEDRWA